MRGIGQWASGPESWGPNWDLPRAKKKIPIKIGPFLDRLKFWGSINWLKCLKWTALVYTSLLLDVLRFHHLFLVYLCPATTFVLTVTTSPLDTLLDRPLPMYQLERVKSIWQVLKHDYSKIEYLYLMSTLYL